MKTNTVQDMFRYSKAEWLDEARYKARKLLERQLYITASDVLLVCPLPAHLHRNTIGMLFRHPDFTLISYTKSRTRSRHGGVVGMWRLTHEPALPRFYKQSEMVRND